MNTDNRVFIIRCKIGTEVETSMALMRKYMEIKETNQSIRIYSTIALENINGVVYIEARNIQSVQILIQGFINIKTNLIKLVPFS